MANRRSCRQPADEKTVEQLIGSLAAGDITAFERIQHSTGTLLFDIAYRYLRNRADADEVVGDVYTRLWLRCAQFDPARGSANAWLSTLCRNAAIDSLRSLRKHARNVSVEVCPELVEDCCPESIVERWQICQVLLSAIGRLPVPQSRMMLLNFRDGMSHQQISSAHSVPLGTVKSNINRSLQRLRQEMRSD